MKKAILTSLFFIFLQPLFISAQTDFDEFKNIQTNDFEQYRNTVSKDFEKYKKELKEAFLKYRLEVTKVWGDKNGVMPNKKVWVQYRDNMRERNIVDFEKGVAKVEVAFSQKDKDGTKKIIARLEKALKKIISARPDKRSVVEISKKPSVIIEDKKRDPVLNHQVKDRFGNNVDYKNAGKFAKDLANGKNIEFRNIKGSDGKKRVVASITFPLVPDHLKKRVNQYKKTVLKESKKRSIDTKLIYAVIETESAFNPTAKSPVPAFGLMQLVPVSGGRDAYKLVHGKDKAPTDRYLYNPDKNIELGTAYFYILYYKYLKEIENKESRLWCAVAAYNTGVGNVLNTFAGKYSKWRFKGRSAWKKKGFTKINSMSPQDVFKYLKQKLPYKETRDYVVKVRSRIPKYSSISN